MFTDADVIIAGAGPAGTLAAYELALRGIDTLILEKLPFPRYKVCGAGLTHKIIEAIPYDISTILETKIHSIVFSKDFSEKFMRTSEEALMYCTQREKFDGFLLQKAIDAGARVIHGEQVMNVTQDDGGVTVITRTGRYAAKLVIGADGASGNVARAAGLHRKISRGLAWEGEVMVDQEALQSLCSTIFLDWGSFPGGYGWVFPKGDHFSIGVGGPARLSKWMMPYYQKMLKYLEGDEVKNGMREGQSNDFRIRVVKAMSLKSWPIPVRRKMGKFHAGRMLVAGDAAGLSDPLTGEGIYYAVRSGLLAAGSCAGFLQGKTTSLEGYTRSVNEELMPELLEAHRIKHLFNAVPSGIHRFVRDNDRAWRALGKVLRGERGYADVRKGLGRWQVLWGAVCHISRWISVVKEKRFARKGFR